jgi:flagellar basal-body rod modification protein FlgD
LGKDEFLNLLVAQLNNQDPLSPQDNGAFIAQLAQFSQVEGIGKLNTSMESLLSGYQSSQALQASSLVGRKVIVPTDKAVVDTKETFKASLALPVSSGNVYVNVYDSAGTSVSRVNLGAQTAGNVSFMWDGKDAGGKLLPPGTYRFEAQAGYGTETQGLSTMLPANVDSVTLGQGGGELMLNLAGLGSIGLSKVQVIGQ